MQSTAYPVLEHSDPSSSSSSTLPSPNPVCCSTAKNCCDIPLIACADEHCQQGEMLDDYCEDCVDHDTCQVPGCTLSCDECCDNTNCPDLHYSSSTHTTCSPTLGHLNVTTPLESVAFHGPFDISAPQDDYYSYHCHWNHCDFSFTSLFELDHHLFNHIPAITQTEDPLNIPLDWSFQCQWDECQTKTPNEIALVQHVKQNHLPETAAKEHHQCHWVRENGHVCNMCCASAEALSTHLEDDHLGSGKGSYTCFWENCTREHKPFVQRQKAIRHIRTHTGLKAFKCETCGKSYATQEILSQHQRLHTKSRPYTCPLCHKTFTTSSALLVHSRVHTGEKPLQCRVCGKRFGESSNLRKHERVHVGERKFVCPVEGCGKKFLRLDQLKRHAKVHSQE